MMKKQYEPRIDTFYNEKERLYKKINEFEQKEKELFENYIKENSIEIINIEKINHTDYGKQCVKFKITDINGKTYLSVFCHNLHIPICDYDFKEMCVYEITAVDKNYDISKRYRFYFSRMVITKYN